MSAHEPRRSVSLVPTLDRLEAELTFVDDLPVAQLVAVTRRVERLAADLRIALIARLGEREMDRRPDRVVLIEEAAEMLRTSQDSLYMKWRKLPFAFKDRLDGRLKFRVSGIERYIASGTGRNAS
jgi:hypothetical protein